jgi:DNA-binding response OmpR family regulator
LLKYLLKHPERILSREEIAKEVWNMSFDTGTNFIDVYINYLRKKIDKPFAQKLIQTRTGMGFILSQST